MIIFFGYFGTGGKNPSHSGGLCRKVDFNWFNQFAPQVPVVRFPSPAQPPPIPQTTTSKAPPPNKPFVPPATPPGDRAEAPEVSPAPAPAPAPPPAEKVQSSRCRSSSGSRSRSRSVEQKIKVKSKQDMSGMWKDAFWVVFLWGGLVSPPLTPQKKSRGRKWMEKRRVENKTSLERGRMEDLFWRFLEQHTYISRWWFHFF